MQLNEIKSNWGEGGIEIETSQNDIDKTDRV